MRRDEFRVQNTTRIKGEREREIEREKEGEGERWRGGGIERKR